MDVVKLLFRCDRVNFAVTITLGTKAPKYSIGVEMISTGTMDWCHPDSYTTKITHEGISEESSENFAGRRMTVK